MKLLRKQQRLRVAAADQLHE